MSLLKNKKWVLFVNVIKRCNIDCPRCYITEEHRKDAFTLPLSTFDSLISSSIFSHSDVTIIYQGGEPTLVGKETFYEYANLVEKRLPNARQTMVSNCIGVKPWHIDLSKRFFTSSIETTFALGMKKLLSGSEKHYTELFIKGLNSYHSAGINCTVNIELNRETYELGPERLASFLSKVPYAPVEFDHSVDFRAYFDSPNVNDDEFPTLPPMLSYKEVATFLRGISQQNISNRCNTLKAFETQDASEAFNVQSENQFLTLNPDGNMTTNPLYSDIIPSYIGNINTEGLSQILSSSKRLKRIQGESKRLLKCYNCSFVESCQSGPSHLPLYDSNGSCAGLIDLYRDLDSAG